MPRIEILNITKKFGEVSAVKNLSLEIPDGAFFTLLGPSGCGKTTTLRMVAGLENPTEGIIRIDNRTVFSSKDWTVVQPSRRKIGLVFQSYALWPHMTVWDNIAFGLKVRKLSSEEIKKRINSVLKQLKIEDLEQRYPSELSGGEQQRVAVARELVTGTKVLLMDEPLGNLDAKLRTEMRAELKRLHNETGQTIIYVTHDQLEAMTLSTHVAVMKEGVVQQLSNPDKLYTRPSNIFVAQFVGTPPINLLEVDVENGLIKGKDLEITLPKDQAYVSGEAIMGIRPESLGIVGKPNDRTVEAVIDSVLPAGNQVLVKIRIGDKELNIEEKRGFKGRMGEKVRVEFNLDEAVFFHKESGKLIIKYEV